MKKNNNVLIIVLVFLLLISVGIICYLLGINSVKDNNNNDNNNSNLTEEKENNINNSLNQGSTTQASDYIPKCVENNQVSLTVDIDETKYNNVIDYLKIQQDVKIELDYCDMDTDEQTKYILNQTEKNSALNEISSHYIENTGLGGGACVPTTKISYTRNNNPYFIEYFGHVMSSNDGNIYKIIDKTATVSQTAQEDCHYFVKSLGSTINNIIKYER